LSKTSASIFPALSDLEESTGFSNLKHACTGSAKLTKLLFASIILLHGTKLQMNLEFMEWNGMKKRGKTTK
jgi:hypothetical protein